ncbi:hypothetical protein [Sporosarcina sp. Te-1]|uniref:hypothetical protein n=1 Tax=Sporosarcina sp. Te-1 TaxID=2818390 RepID=UPI001A9E31AE|nr:hypothetical protein [Sporosarcina sp. Te-1]QTD42628.1 hypothetical protein J3U78_07450 [Sporosarcina sp. Te-1]
MGNIKKILWVILTLSLIFSLYYIGTKNKKNIASDMDIELSLKEAISLGLDRAKKWDKESYLIKLTSVDETKGGTRGVKGKRYNWNLFFETPNKNQQFIVGISEGEIKGTHVGQGTINGDPITLDDIKFDSPYLVRTAQEKYELQKGVDWATGYHFLLDSENGKPIATVLGNDRDSLFTRISFDVRNGEIVNAMKKIPKGGGLTKVSLDSGNYKHSNIGKAILGISAKNNQAVIWGDRKPRTFNFSVQPFIEFSKNNGWDWNTLNFNEVIIDAWVTDENELYTVTELGIWHIKTNEKMKNIFSVETKIEKVDYATNNNIAILSGNYIHKTRGHVENWDKIIQPESQQIISLQISNNGEVIVLTSNGQVLFEDGDKWTDIELAQGIETPSYMKVIGDDLFLLSDHIWVRNIRNGEWNKIETDYKFSKLIKKGNNLFGITEDETIYLIKFGGDAKEWHVERVFEALTDGIIADLELTQDALFIATVPDFYWEIVN